MAVSRLISCLVSIFSLPLVSGGLPREEGCSIYGRHFRAGELVTGDPCDPCYCSPYGAIMCVMLQCPTDVCVDKVQPPGQCCKECPNGPNCNYGYWLEKVIPWGEVYHPNATHECRCVGSSIQAECYPVLPSHPLEQFRGAPSP